MTVLAFSNSGNFTELPYFLAIYHFMIITYVIVSAFRITFPLTKFYSLFLLLQQTLLNRTREIWWKNLTQWSSWNHILMSLNFWDVLQNLVCFAYAGLILLCTFCLWFTLWRFLVINNLIQWKSQCFTMKHNKKPSHEVILPFFSLHRRSWIFYW